LWFGKNASLYCSPERALEDIIGLTGFEKGEQTDIHEFLVKFLNLLDQELG